MGWVLGLAGTAGPRSALLLEPWRGAGGGGRGSMGGPGPPDWRGGHRAAGREPGTHTRGGGAARVGPGALPAGAARPACCGAQDGRQGALRAPALPPPPPPVGGAALSPQPPPQPPPGPPRVPGGSSAAAAGSSMRTEPGPGHGDPQHHGPGQPFCLPRSLPPVPGAAATRARGCAA